MPDNIVIHKPEIGNILIIKVNAGDVYSENQIQAKEGEVYRIWCDTGQWWVDMVIPSGANGYYNPLANMFGQRVKGVKCFCLCGTYDNNDSAAFAIGSAAEITITQRGQLSFFANDVPGYEWNNWGSIQVNIERLR